MKQNNNKDQKQGLFVEVRNGDFNKALRLFKKKVANSGIIQEVRDREYYEKPTTKRKRAKAAAKSRWKRQQEKLNPTSKRLY